MPKEAKSPMANGSVCRPTLTKEFSSRSQVDLIECKGGTVDPIKMDHGVSGSLDKVLYALIFDALKSCTDHFSSTGHLSCDWWTRYTSKR